MPRRKALLAARVERQARFDAGEVPDFPAETADIRAAEWRVAPAPADLQDRRVEITGPTNAKMVINALNSGAKVFMADFEDATAPAFDTLIDGQANLIDRWRGTLAFDDPATGKNYRVGDDPAVLMVRPRGLHLDEAPCHGRRRAAVGVAVRFRALPVPQCRGRDRGRVGPLLLSAQARGRRARRRGGAR